MVGVFLGSVPSDIMPGRLSGETHYMEKFGSFPSDIVSVYLAPARKVYGK